MQKTLGCPVLAVLLFVAATLCHGGPVLTCGRCGYEIPPGATACAHCGTPLPGSEADPAPGTAEEGATPEEGDAAGHALRRAAREEYEAARAALAREEYALAIALAVNADALRAAGGPGGSPSHEKTGQVLQQAMDGLFIVSRPCFACKGSGSRVQPILGLKGEVVIQSVPNEPCPSCGGRGFLRGGRTPEQVRRLLAAATRQSRDFHRQRDFQADSGGWLPAGVEENLSAAERAAFRSRLARTCSTCLGHGREVCVDCGGTRYQACPNEACVMGQQVCPVCNGALRINDPSRERTFSFCDHCRRRGIMPCEVCAGAARVSCGTCDGQGTRLCEGCRGTGENALCRSCEGAGLTPCRKCDGSGLYKGAECPSCQGEAETLCRRCQGAGRRLPDP